MKIRYEANAIKFETAMYCRELRLTQLAIAVAATLTQLPALAQQTAEVMSAELPAKAIQEVVITAEKRGSTVRKTPLSITAVSGDDLIERGVSSATQLARETPGVATKSNGPGQTEFSIRGMSSSAGVSATVGLYLDEIPVSPPTLASGGKTAIDPDLYDLARVEILRGPQGTLYGASSMGGTIKLVPVEPKLDKSEGSIQLKGSATASGGPNGTANAMVNIPLAENLAALRVVATKKHNSGWIDRVVVSDFPLPEASAGGDYYSAPRGDVAGRPASKTYKDVNSESLESVRAALLIRPADGLSIVPSVMYQRIRQGGPDLFDVSPGNPAHYQPFDQDEPFMDRFANASVKVVYDTDNWSVTSATSYSKRTRRQVQDASEILLKGVGDGFGINAYSATDGGFGASNIVETSPMRQLTQEVRISSNGTGQWKWIAGVFYSDLKSTYQAVQTAPQAMELAGTTNIYTASLADHLKQSAIFGNVSYDILDNLRATVGLRYFSSKDTASNADSGLFSSGGGETTSTKADGYNPMFNLSYTASANTLLYATAAKGFRDGAAQHGVPASCGPDLASLGLTESPHRYAPDTVWSYELGSKTRLLGGKLDINAAAYQMKWNNMQQLVLLPNCGFTYTDNVAAATMRGFELEAKARITPALVLEQGVGYTHARITSASSQAPSKVGDKLLNVPAWTASTSLRHTVEIDENRSFVTRFNASYVGPQDSLTAQRSTLPGYTMLALRAGVQTDSWTLSVYVDNLADKRVAYGNTQSLTLNTPGLDRASTSRPRTIGIDYTRGF